MTITTLPTPPSTDSPSNFDSRADAFLAALPTFVTETNALAAAMTAIAGGTAITIPYVFSTTTGDGDPGNGYLRLDNATQASATTIRADLVGSDGTTWTDVIATFDDATSTVKGHIMLQKTTDASKWLLYSVSSLATPSGYRNITVANVASSGANPLTNGDAIILKFTRTGDKGDAGASGTFTFPRSERTSNTKLVAADKGYLIDITSGTFSQTFDAAATLGDGWCVFIRNRGDGTITLDPDGSETVGGATTLAMSIGDTYLVECNGSNFSAVLLNKQDFSNVYTTSTSTATFTVPANVYCLRAYVFGAGGAGGTHGTAAAGGGGGGCTYGSIPTVPGTVFTFGISGSTVTLKVSSTTYLSATSGAAASAGTYGAGGAAGSVGAGLNIFDSGAYAGGDGGAAATGGGAGGGASGSPIGTGGAGGAVSADGMGAGGGGWGGAGGAGYAAAGSGGGGCGGAGFTGDSYGGHGGGAGGAAASGRPGIGRTVITAFTDVLLKKCTSPGGAAVLTAHSGTMPFAGDGAGGGGATNGAGYGGGGGMGGGGGGCGGSSNDKHGGHGGFGGGGGGADPTASASVGGNGGIGGGGGGGDTGGSGGAAAVVIFY